MPKLYFFTLSAITSRGILDVNTLVVLVYNGIVGSCNSSSIVHLISIQSGTSKLSISAWGLASHVVSAQKSDEAMHSDSDVDNTTMVC